MGILAFILGAAVIALAAGGAYLNSNQELARYKRDGVPQEAFGPVAVAANATAPAA